MRKELKTAIELHRTGQLDQATALYQSILARAPDNAEALHWLGVLWHQQGYHVRAVNLLERAITVRPDAYMYHANLAESYRALGALERAAESCRAALKLWPDYPEALCNLGGILQDLGRFAEAVEPLERALALRPNFVVAHNNLGISLRKNGRGTEALAHFRRAVELDPAFARAHSNLGQLLLERDQPEAALPHAEEAVRLDPSAPGMHDNLGNILYALERFEEARNAYVNALEHDPENVLVGAHLALALRGEGRYGEALPWISTAVERDPDNAAFQRWLAELHDEMEDPHKAIPCWERVLTLQPKDVSARIALAQALREEHRPAEARAQLDTAIAIQPDSGLAHLKLGGLLEELGALSEAEASIRTALRVQPGLPLPYARLATLLRGKLPDADLSALEERLAGKSLAPAQRAHLLYGLAHVLDARGEYDRAARSIEEANSLTRQLPNDRRTYDPDDHARLIDELMTAFNRDFFARLQEGGSDSRRPVFVVGLPRSGTTLVEQVLASHSQIFGAGELRLGRMTFDAVPELLGRSEPARSCVGALDRAHLGPLAEKHLDRLAAIDGGRWARVVDKMPENYVYLGLFAVLFPRATIIHCRRDLRDVAVSCWMTDFKSVRWASDPQHIARRFQGYRRLMNYWQDVLPHAIHHVDYEETVADLESVARRLIAACGLEWEPACLEFYRSDRPVRTASVTQVRQPVYQRSVARWKHYENALGALFAALPER